MAGRASTTARLWQGVRMHRRAVAPGPDAEPVAVCLPAAWDDAAAAALALLAGGPADLVALADPWLTRLAAADDPALAAGAHDLLLRRIGAPEAATWRAPGAVARYRLNLASLCDHGVEPEAVAKTAVAAMRALCPAREPTVVVNDLAGWLARSGLDYAAPEGRAAAAALLRRIGTAGARLEAGTADPVDALLGAETCGIAPAFSPLDGSGALTAAASGWLAARGIAPGAALAAALAGEAPVPIATAADHLAMVAALRPLLAADPPAPLALPAPRAVHRRAPPRRRAGIAQRASLGGQKVYVATGEYADGTPCEVSLALPQASSAVRALAEALGHAVGIGLQHGAPLAEYLDAFAATRFAPAGAVDGDPAVRHATSPLDYLARVLAAAYVPGMVLPPPELEAEDAPPLPLDLAGDAAPRRRGLRVVK